MTLLNAALLLGASFLGGMINSIAGGGTLVTFPMLLAAGLDARIANATSTVALFPGSASAVFGFRRELSGSRAYLIRLGITSILGGALGATLLLLTPSETFDRLVPFLILFATLLFAAGETISRKLGLRLTQGDTEAGTANVEPRTSWWVGAIVVQLFSATYGGYFGAGNGILMLASLGLLGVSDIHRANGIKNFLAVCINAAAVTLFVFGGLVEWKIALLMSVGAIAGGYYGAGLAKKLGRGFVRWAVISIGLVIGLMMLWRLKG